MTKNISYYSQDGRGNNIHHPEWGGSSTPRIRSMVKKTSYVDGISQPKTEEHGLPSARSLLVELFQRIKPKPDKNMSQLLLYFGQFVAHDITRSIESTDKEKESMPMPCGFSTNSRNSGEKYMTPPHPIPHGSLGACNMAALASKFSLCPAMNAERGNICNDSNVEMFDPFTRVQRVEKKEGIDGFANQATTSINFATSFLDLSHVYGPYQAGPDQTKLRSFEDGKMILDFATGLPPKDPQTGQFLMADPMSRKTPPFTSLVILFLQYHNLRADHHAQHSELSLSDEDLYWLARKDTTHAYQNLVEEKYLPTLLGEQLDPYEKYDFDIDPSMDVYFAASSFRYGHASLSGLIRRLNKDFGPIPGGPWLLRDVFDRTEAFLSSKSDVASVLRGLAAEASKAIDLSFADDVAFFTGQMAVYNVQRGRDQGLPSYNDARESFGLDKISSYHNISDGDEFVEKTLARLYRSVDDIDAYVGELLDAKNEVLKASLKEQFSRLRDGDRFWYKQMLNETEIAGLPTLTEMMIMTFGEKEMAHFPGDSFAVANGNPIHGVSNDDTLNSLSLLDGLLDINWGITWDAELGQSIDMTLKVHDLVNGGFIGIGWGAQLMRDADIWFCTAKNMIDPPSNCLEGGPKNSHNLSSTPLFSCCVASAKSRAVPKCFDNNLLVVTDSCISEEESFVKMRAPLCKQFGSENCFDLPNDETDYIAAYNQHKLAAHGFSRRTMGKVDLTSGFGSSASNESSNGGLFALHGAMMLICWFIIVPIAIWIVRYCKERSWRLTAHIGLVGVAGSVVLSIAPAAIVSFEGTSFGTVDGGSSFSRHKVIGLCVIGLVFFMLLTGEARLTREINSLLKSPRIDRMVFLLHRAGGFCLITTAWLNCYIGLVHMEAYEIDSMEITWFSTITTSSGVGFFRTFRNYIFIPLVVIICLLFTLTEYRQYRAARNLSIETKDDKNVGIRMFDEEFQASVNEMTVETFLDLTRQGRPLCIVDGYVIDIGDFMTYHPGGSRVLRGTIGADITQQLLGQRDVDGIVHIHSPIAFRKLRTLVKARLPGSQSLQSDLESSDQRNEPSSLLVFREGKIVDYTYVIPDNSRKSKPTLRLLISLKKEALDEISSDSDTPLPSTTFVFRGKDTFGTIVERPYTPLRYFLRSSEGDAKNIEVIYEFFISLVSNGMMSTYLREMKTGEHIMIQGPLANTSLLKKMHYYEDRQHHLICIASGTGISPILQVIDHYCDQNEKKRNNRPKKKVFLVWFLQFTVEMSSSFKGAVRLDSRRQKFGDNFRYIIIYAKTDHPEILESKEVETGEKTFRQAELKSQKLQKHRTGFFRKKEALRTFHLSSVHTSINYVLGKERDDFEAVQSLYNQKRRFDREIFYKLFSGFAHNWDGEQDDTFETKEDLETIHESNNPEDNMEKRIRSLSLIANVVICGSPIFDDACVEFCKEFNFEDKQIFLFGPGDSSLKDIEMLILKRRIGDRERGTSFMNRVERASN